MNQTLLLSLLCAGALLAGLLAAAKDKHGKPMKSPKASAEVAPSALPDQAPPQVHARAPGSEPWLKAEFRFSDTERTQIRQYVESYPGKGAGNPRQLPPGLAKKVARGESLPLFSEDEIDEALRPRTAP